MNKDKLKIKHLFNIYNLSINYPNEEDVLYLYIKGLYDTYNDDKVFENRLLRKFTKDLPKKYDNEKEIMNYFVSLGYFEIVNRYRKTNTEIIEYKLINHPWQE